MQVVAGVDCHKGSHSIAFVDAVGKPIRTLTIEASDVGYRKAVLVATSFGDVVWGLESTGCYGNRFATVLNASGFTVYEVPGAYTKRHREQGSRRGKSDPIDAQAIAEVVLRETDRLPRFRDAIEREAIRLRYEQRDRLVRERTQTINRLRSAALRLNARDLPGDLTSTRALDNLKHELQQTDGSNATSEALLDDCLDAMEDIIRISGRIRRIERFLAPVMRRIAPELLEMRGVSTVTAAGLIGHAGDMRNCRNADAFAMKSGVAPIPLASGRRQGVRVNVGGNRQLNRLLYSIALVQLRSDDHAGRKYFDRKRSEGKSSKSALRCLKRQLATVIYFRLVAAQPRLLAEAASIAA
jgi:transposase